MENAPAPSPLHPVYGMHPRIRRVARTLVAIPVAAAAITGLNAAAIEDAVLQRERMMPTGLGLTVAVPHARMHGMNKPVVCLGLSREGIEFDAPDGERSRMIFMILTPADDDGAQLEILADISRTFLDSSLREGSLRVSNFTEFIAVLKTREKRKFHVSTGGETTAK